MKKLSGVDLYLSKLHKDGRMNGGFMGCFGLPKDVRVFVVLTTVVMSAIELRFHVWVPSVLAIYIMWECLTVYMAMEKIAEDCTVEEVVMQQQLIEGDGQLLATFPDDPYYITEEDRDFILLTRVMSFKNMSLLERAREYYLGIIIAAVLYAAGYLAMRYLL